MKQGIESKKIGSKEIGISLSKTNAKISYINETGVVDFVKEADDISIPLYAFYEDRKTVCFGNETKQFTEVIGDRTSISSFIERLDTNSEKFIIDLADKEEEIRYYIFDTNIFIEYPDILEEIQENEKVVLPITVHEELKFRAQDNKTKYSAQRALEQLIKYCDIVEYEESDLSLLSDDFFKNFTETFNNAHNDNKILSIALKYKKKNGILVSSDSQLVRLKSKFVNVEAMTLEEFQALHLSKLKEDKIEVSGVEVLTMFLNYLKENAERTLKSSVTKAVIAVPAIFNDSEIENTKQAAYDAGFEEIYVEREPIIASIAYNIDSKKEETIFVYNFGRKTFDISIIQSDGNGNFKVCAAVGNKQLGGEDITSIIEEYIYDYLEDTYELVMFDKAESSLNEERFMHNKQAIYLAAENCKIELSTKPLTTIVLRNIYITNSEQESIHIDLSRQTFEDRIKPTINQTITTMNMGLKKANLLKEQIDNIILVGGTSLIPCIKEQVERYFGRSIIEQKNSITLIAEGTAFIAQSLYGQATIQEYDMTDEDFGIALNRFQYDCIVPVGTRLPIRIEKKYLLFRDNPSQLDIKVYSRSKNAQNVVKVFHRGIIYLGEVVLKELPQIKKSEADIVIKFEITKRYELKVEALLLKKDGTCIAKGEMSFEHKW